jgi:hypothetical protein
MNRSHNTGKAEIDYRRSADLNNQGSNFLAAYLVCSDFRDRLMLISYNVDDGEIIDVTCRNASHEQLGPLPAEWLARIQTARA